MRMGQFELEAQTRRLLRDGQPVTVGGRAFDLLLALAERADRVVGKNELMDSVWPGLVVEENNLQVQIGALRKLLGAQSIVTVPGRGYRLTLPIDAPESKIEASKARASAETPELAAGKFQPPYASDLLPPLYGREADIAQVRALLEAHRVVSIVGAGGIGKTRLAQAVAAEACDAYDEGVYAVELAALSVAELVASETARALGLPASDVSVAVASVARALRSRSMLLLLDNCEHLVNAVASLVEAISETAPRVRILVTSQEPLKTTIEQVYRLGTLSVPASPTLADAQASSAVQLFVSRAQATDPRFALTADIAESVAEICTRLDGIPLAVELAAARVSLLGIEGLRARLDERLQLLTGGSRLVLRRHQTLRATLDFSHGLLSAEEQAVFRRVGVFAGGFAVETAQVVAADDTMDSWAVLDHLGALVDKSVIVAEGGRFPRLHLLETTRAFALERLADAGETKTMLGLHARAVARLFSELYDKFWEMSDAEWLSRCEADLDNLRAALAWSLRNDMELAIALTGDSRPLWLELGLQPEAQSVCKAALALTSAVTPRRAAGRLWLASAVMVANPRPTQMRDDAACAVELLRDAGDRATLAVALMAVAFWSKSPPTKQQLDALKELELMTTPQCPARMQLLLPNATATIHRGGGRFSEARRDYEVTRDLAARVGATRWELWAQCNVGDVALIMGDVDDAVAIYRRLEPRLALVRDKLLHLFAFAGLATALLLKADPTGAHEALNAAAPLIVFYDMGFRFAATAALLAARGGGAFLLPPTCWATPRRPTMRMAARDTIRLNIERETWRVKG